jgi:hypothetical protein
LRKGGFKKYCGLNPSVPVDNGTSPLDKGDKNKKQFRI